MVRRNAENNDRRTEQFRKLFIGGLTPLTDEEKLKEYYGQWGEIVDVVVMKDNKTGRSRGFGFITYKEAEMVDEAQNNRPHEIDGKTVEAKRAMPREDSTNPESHMTVNKLFVGALKKDVTTEDLKDYFDKYGNIIECEVVTWKESGDSRGFGFVTFDDYDPVDKAILYKPHHIGSSRADVKKALSKEQMQEIKKKQTNTGGYGGSSSGGLGASNNYGSFANVYGNGFERNGGANYNPQNTMGGAMSGGFSNYGDNGGWNQGSTSWNQGGMGDGFGQYNNQNYGGGPMRGGGNNFGGQRTNPYGGSYSRR